MKPRMKPSAAFGRNQILSKPRINRMNDGRKKGRNTNETLIHENCRSALETLTGPFRFDAGDTERNEF